jgi:hypothetical protein
MPAAAGPRFLDVDPRSLRLPPPRASGADPFKLQQQIARHGRSTQGMPAIEVTQGANGELMINSGVTRATRVAKLLPGQTVRVEVIDRRPNMNLTHLPTVGDNLP